MAASVSGSLTTTASVTLTKTSADSEALFEIFGTYGSVTFVFEGTIDSSHWFPLSAGLLSTRAVTNGTISPGDNTTVGYVVGCEGCSGVRLRTTNAGMTGTLSVVGKSGTFSGQPFISQNNAGSTISGLTVFSAGISFNGATGVNTISMPDNLADALDVREGSNQYLTFVTTDGSEQITVSKALAIADAVNVPLATTTGTKIGTATTQKLGFWNATPIVQPTNSTDLYNVLVNTGLIASGGTPAFSPPGAVNIADNQNIVLATTNGSKIGTATTQKLGFYNKSPVVQPAANSDTTTGAAGSTTTVFLNTTFTGAGGTAAYTVGGVVTALKALGLLAT